MAEAEADPAEKLETGVVGGMGGDLFSDDPLERAKAKQVIADNMTFTQRMARSVTTNTFTCIGQAWTLHGVWPKI